MPQTIRASVFNPPTDVDFVRKDTTLVRVNYFWARVTF